MKKHYVAEIRCVRTHWEGEPDEWTRIAVIGDSREHVIQRWNELVNKKSADKYNPPLFPSDTDRIEWKGSTSGGCYSVEYTATIKKYEEYL